MSLNLERLKTVVAHVLVPTVTSLTAVGVVLVDRNVKRLDSEMQIREADRLDEVEARNTAQQLIDLRFRIYDAVTQSLQQNDPNRQRVATALVVSFLDPADSLRAGLLQVLAAEGAPEVRTTAQASVNEAQTFTIEEDLGTRQSNIASGQWVEYNVDVFWCTNFGDAARQTADRVVSALQSNGAQGRIRRRELPASINSSPGYRLSGFVIRRHSSEVEAAGTLKRLIDPLIAGVQQEFAISGTSTPTPGYLSVFVCN